VQIWSDDVDIQQFVAWVNEQNNVISEVEIGNEARQTERPTADIIQNVGEQNEVAYPYQNDVVPFLESRSTALHRLKCTERKLEKTKLVQKYAEKLRTWGFCAIDQNYGIFLYSLSRTCTNRARGA
jgi:hypothetical protein